MAPSGRRKRSTATDVASAAGVSQSAVSRTFTPGASVAPETRKRVLAAAAKLGYRPNAIARSLITRRSRIVAVAMAYFDNHFYPGVLEALSNGLQGLGYQVLLFTAAHGGAADPVFDEVMRYQVDAVVLASTTLSSALARECRQAGVPVVMFNRTIDEPNISSVVGDNERGARIIAHFLADAGYRRMGFVAGLEQSSTNRDRERGFRVGLGERGLPMPQRAVGNYTWTGAAEATRALLRARHPPEAIFYANDHMAIAGMEVLRAEAGLSVPGDIGVVGFDDVGPASWPSFRLTTFSQPLQPMVQATVDLLAHLLDESNPAARRTIVAGELVVRESTRLPRVSEP
jgi:DNA-binding LacI/PurR family transcriptional regulator